MAVPAADYAGVVKVCWECIRSLDGANQGWLTFAYTGTCRGKTQSIHEGRQRTPFFEPRRAAENTFGATEGHRQNTIRVNAGQVDEKEATRFTVFFFPRVDWEGLASYGVLRMARNPDHQKPVAAACPYLT